MTTEYADIIARLASSKGEDRELDAAIIRRYAPDLLERAGLLNLTTSRDACARLQEEVLPGSTRSAVPVGPRYPKRGYGIIVHCTDLEFSGDFYADHPTSEPRAHLIAILRAKGVEG